MTPTFRNPPPRKTMTRIRGSTKCTTCEKACGTMKDSQTTPSHFLRGRCIVNNNTSELLQLNVFRRLQHCQFIALLINFVNKSWVSCFTHLFSASSLWSNAANFLFFVAHCLFNAPAMAVGYITPPTLERVSLPFCDQVTICYGTGT